MSGPQPSEGSLVPAAMINGRPSPLEEARLPLTDAGVARGDGAFETIGVWDGVPFRVDSHLQRLAHSLELLGLEPPDEEALRRDIELILDGVSADAALRLYVTASGTRVVTLDHQPQRRVPERLAVQTASWIAPPAVSADQRGWRGGPKSMSYAPNVAATRAAQRAGADDALLVTVDGFVAEGSTFAVLWVRDGILHAPDLDLGIVDSVSRRFVLEIAARDLEISEGRWPVESLADVDEIVAVSTLRDVVAVRSVEGVVELSGPTPVRDALSAALWTARRPTSR